MTEQQTNDFALWFEQFMDPELNLTPGDKELCQHAWQAALSHAERREFKTEQDLISFLDGLYETAGPDSSALTGQKWVAAQRAIEGIRSHAEGEAPNVYRVLFDATADKKFIKKSLDDGSLAFFDTEQEARAKARRTGTDYMRVEYYKHPAPQVAPVPWPKREDVTEDMRAGFERLYREKAERDGRTLERNEQGAYAHLTVQADWIFYQRAWADALEATAPQVADIDAIAKTLIAAWAKAEPDHGVTKYPASYVATFADMARAVASMVPAAPQVAVPEQRDDMIPEHFTVGECRGFRTGYNYLRDLLAAAPAGEPAEWPEPQDAMTAHLQDAARKAGYRPHELNMQLSMFAGYVMAGMIPDEAPVSQPGGLGVAEECPECGSTALEWGCTQKGPADVADGRLRLNEVEAVFVLGCTACSETVRTMDAHEACRMLLSAPDEREIAALREDAARWRYVRTSLPVRTLTSRGYPNIDCPRDPETSGHDIPAWLDGTVDAARLRGGKEGE